VTAERIPRQDAGVNYHHHAADADSETAVAKERRHTLPSRADEKKQRAVKGIALEVLSDEQGVLFAMAPLDPAHRAGWRRQE
jgi:hypothetical protein